MEVEPKYSLHDKEESSLCEAWMLTQCCNVDQIILLCTLKALQFCQLYLSRTGKKKRNIRTLSSPFPSHPHHKSRRKRKFWTWHLPFAGSAAGLHRVTSTHKHNIHKCESFYTDLPDKETGKQSGPMAKPKNLNQYAYTLSALRLPFYMYVNLRM